MVAATPVRSRSRAGVFLRMGRLLVGRARSRLGRHNEVTHHVYNNTAIPCESVLDIREPRPTNDHAALAVSQTTLAQTRELGQVTTMRVLVVEDDEKIASFVTKGLKQNGYAVDHAADGEHGLDLATAIDYDLLVLDLMLPKLDGLSLLRRLRQEKIRTPVLILSARANVDDRVRGLQAGSDDYLTKPFAFSELLARVQALIRRANQAVEHTQLTVADLSMNVITREVTRDGQRIDLHPREFSLLEFLLRHAGRPVTKTMILEHIWDFHFDPQTNVVDVLIHRLRAKIDKNFPVKLIQTIRGVGYVVKAG